MGTTIAIILTTKVVESWIEWFYTELASEMFPASTRKVEDFFETNRYARYAKRAYKAYDTLSF